MPTEKEAFTEEILKENQESKSIILQILFPDPTIR